MTSGPSHHGPRASLHCSYAPDSVNHWWWLRSWCIYYTSIDHLVVDATGRGHLSPVVVLVGRRLIHDPQLKSRPRGVYNVCPSQCLHPVFMGLKIAGFAVGAEVHHVPQSRGIWTIYGLPHYGCSHFHTTSSVITAALPSVVMRLR